MVKRKAPLVATVTGLLLAGAVALSGASHASGGEEPAITEEYTVTLNRVGEAHVVDRLIYSRDASKMYDAVRKVAKKSPRFLSRKYTSEAQSGEVNNFDARVDAGSRSITLTFDAPGYAYDMRDYWVVFGWPMKPKRSEGREFVFEYNSKLNNEFTLFNDYSMSTRATIKVPEGARNARWDEKKKSIRYEMGPASSLYGFWSEKKSLMTAVFAVLTALFAGMLIFVYTRKTKEGLPGAREAAREAGVSAVAPSPPPEAEARHIMFCRNCGHQLSPGKHFCPKCGMSI